MTTVEELKPYSFRANFSYLVGVYLATNALPEAVLYVDGPDCAFYKAQLIHGRHDLSSTLFDCTGRHRIRTSDATVNRIVGDRTAALARDLQEIGEEAGCSVILVAAMPMAAMTGTQYDLLLRQLQPQVGKPLVEIPSRSLDGDWLDGYADTLAALARAVPLESGRRDPAKAAVVGYLMDRTEQDHVANVAELERMLVALGLEPVSIWLSNRGFSHLGRVGEAGTIVSLPHGREAAAILAGRTGAELVEAGIPFGLKGTVDWVSSIARRLGREAAADRFVEAELESAVPGIQWLVSRYLMGMKVLFTGDPYMLEPMVCFLEELGCDLRGLLAVGSRRHGLRPEASSPIPAGVRAGQADHYGGIPVLWEPTPFEIEELVARLGGPSAIDVAVQSDTYGLKAPGRYAVLPFGCAVWTWHALHEAPYLGFRGALWFIERLVEKRLGALAAGRLQTSRAGDRLD
jgi:nitrogenase molybdenum-iron protein alpha/beta subunit